MSCNPRRAGFNLYIRIQFACYNMHHGRWVRTLYIWPQWMHLDQCFEPKLYMYVCMYVCMYISYGPHYCTIMYSMLHIVHTYWESFIALLHYVTDCSVRIYTSWYYTLKCDTWYPCRVCGLERHLLCLIGEYKQTHNVRMHHAWWRCTYIHIEWWCRRGSLLRCQYWANWLWADT